MRRDRATRPPGIFRSSEWLRLGSMLVMLALVFLLMMRLRDPDTVRAIDALLNLGGEARDVPQGRAPEAPGAAQGDAKGGMAKKPAREPGAAQAPPAQPPEPEPAGPTDEDPEQIEEIRNEFQAVSDRTLSIQPEEMIPYNRIVRWVYSQTASQMRQRARTDLEFNDFVQSPDEHRGQMVELVLHAKSIHQWAGPPMYPSPLYEVWGPTAQSGSWFYVAVVVNLPEGMPVGRNLNERVRVVGYFFKLQGYQRKPGDPPLPAPLVIGRMIWIKPQHDAAEAPDWLGQWAGGAPGWLLWGGLLAVVAVTVAVAWIVGRSRRSTLRRVAPGAGLSPVPPESWLGDDDTPPGEADPDSPRP